MGGPPCPQTHYCFRKAGILQRNLAWNPLNKGWFYFLWNPLNVTTDSLLKSNVPVRETRGQGYGWTSTLTIFSHRIILLHSHHHHQSSFPHRSRCPQDGDSAGRLVLSKPRRELFAASCRQAGAPVRGN